MFKIVESTGAPKTTYKSFNWDQTYRKAIVWTAASNDKNNTPLWRVDDPLQTVAPIVQSELQKQTAPPAPPANQSQPAPPASQTPTPPPVTVAPAAAYDPANYQNFAVTNDGVIFFFDQGHMLPDAAGARRCWYRALQLTRCSRSERTQVRIPSPVPTCVTMPGRILTRPQRRAVVPRWPWQGIRSL